tara:strand:- start:2 stop:1198 length:1197 start_codon:yes stop_codon:yes gene_type:complete
MALTRARNGFWALVVLLAGTAVAYGLLVGKPDPVPESPPQLGPPLVKVLAVQPAQRSLAVVTQGTVRPVREIKLVSRVAGRVERVSSRFAQGGFFSAEEELVKLEDVDYRLAIARAESQVAAARQRLAEERGRALQARREWRDLGSEEANALFLRKPQIAAAEAALRASEADLQAAQLDLQRTAIAAPFNGRISEKNVDIGQYVTPGTPIAGVYATDAVEVHLPLTGRQVALLDLPLNYDNDARDADDGAPVTLRAHFANRDWEWRGRIVRTDASIDEDSRVVYAVAEVAKPFAREPGSERPPLAPGMFVHATISGRPLPDVVELPRSALRSSGDVLIVDAQRRVQARQVHLLDSDERSVWVQGLRAGERVVLREPVLLVAGMEVRIETVAELAAGRY